MQTDQKPPSAGELLPETCVEMIKDAMPLNFVWRKKFGERESSVDSLLRSIVFDMRSGNSYHSYVTKGRAWTRHCSCPEGMIYIKYVELRRWPLPATMDRKWDLRLVFQYSDFGTLSSTRWQITQEEATRPREFIEKNLSRWSKQQGFTNSRARCDRCRGTPRRSSRLQALHKSPAY